MQYLREANFAEKDHYGFSGFIPELTADDEITIIELGTRVWAGLEDEALGYGPIAEVLVEEALANGDDDIYQKLAYDTPLVGEIL